ncbi:MAG: carboxypeptidase regulatory-like domain-containing protein [Candidatus Korobacteraceae bacterium]
MNRVVSIFLVFCLFAVAAGAQSVTDQQISGTVLDASGAALPNATVTITNEGTGATRSTTSNAEGFYVVTNLPVGTYTVAATATGFKRYVAQGVILNVGGKLAVNTRLDVGEVSETVEVQAQALQVETTTGEVGHLVTGTEATSLQLNGRNFVQLVALAPGVSTTYTSSFKLFGPFGVVGAAQSVNGSRPDSSTYLVNGVDNKDPGGPSSNNYVNVSPDFIAEFKTVAAAQGAQYGLNSGATIVTALKSGTRDFHGSVYEYLRNDAIQARSFGLTTKPPLRYNNFGWTLGGPAFIPGKFNSNRDKLFFFVGQDFKRRRFSEVAFMNVPTLAQRQGVGVLQPGDVVNANGQALVNLYPEPNFTGPGGNYRFLNVQPLNVNEYILKGDWIINEKNTISGQFLHDANSFVGGQLNTVIWDRIIPGTLSGVQWTSIVSPTTVNTFLVSFSGNVIKQKQGIQGNPQLGYGDYSRAANGITIPALFGLPSAGAIPTVQIAGFTSLTTQPIQFSNYTRNYMFKNDLSKVVGNHTLKVGIVLNRGRKNQDNPTNDNGTFAFNTAASNSTGNPLRDALLGRFFTYTERQAVPQAWHRYWNIEPYFHDDWRVSQRLTLNAGVRWAYIEPSYLDLGNGSNFMPERFNPARAPVINNAGAITSAPGTYDPYNGLVLTGDGFPDRAQSRLPSSVLNNPAILALFDDSLPKGYANTNWGNFAPRFGFAYDVTGRQTTVVRGGFGLTFERIRPNVINGTTNNPPFGATVEVRNGNVDNPGGGTLSNPVPSIAQSIDPDLKPPRIMNWTLAVQQSFWDGGVFEIGYGGSRGDQMTYAPNINQLPMGTLQANPGVNANALRPYRGYADIQRMANGAEYSYHSLQTQFQKRLQGGGNMRVSYTWSKNLTNAHDAFYQPTDSYNLNRDRGLAYFNKPHVLTVSYNYPLPFWTSGSEWYKVAFGGWSLTGITQYSSGWPLNITIPNDRAGVGGNFGSNTNIEGNAFGGVGQRPNLVGDPYSGTSRIQHLNPAAFANPTLGTYGNLMKHSIKGPRINNWDITLGKNFRLREGINLDFRAEAFNFPNHLSYTAVQTVFGQANFGQVTGATDPRTFEFALRLTF